MAPKYTARIVDVPHTGIRLEPLAGSVPPEHPNDLNLLAMAVALALGQGGYEHHPEPRDAQIQTIEALLAGEAVMPWRCRDGEAGRSDRTVVCEVADDGVAQCRVVSGSGGDVVSFGSVGDLAGAMRRAEAAHAEHERRSGAPDPDWPEWYARYMVAELTGAELPT